MNSTGKIRTATLAIGGAALGLLSHTSPLLRPLPAMPPRTAAFDEVQLPGLPHRGQEAGRTVLQGGRGEVYGDASAPAKLEQKIKNGGSGVWGAIPMPPQQSFLMPIPRRWLNGSSRSSRGAISPCFRSVRVQRGLAFAVRARSLRFLAPLAGAGTAVPALSPTRTRARRCISASDLQKAGEAKVSRAASTPRARRTRCGLPEVFLNATQVSRCQTNKRSSRNTAGHDR